MPLWIGTSGWQYADWRGIVYPQDVPQTDWLSEYSRLFRTVELNASFYRLPQRAVFVRWATVTPADAIVAVKASRYLTHRKKLLDPGEPVARLLERAHGLGDKLGPILVQLPASFRVDVPRLTAALDEFGPGTRLAVELRHSSWFCDPVRDALGERNAALVLADRQERWLTPPWRTADWGYVRFHQGQAEPQPCYGGEVLVQRAQELAGRWADHEDCFVYFNNDPRGCAVRDAAVFAAAWRALGRTATRAPDPGDTRVVN